VRLIDHRGGRAAHQQDQSEHLVEDEIQQPQRHNGDHAQPLDLVDHPWSATVAEFWNPTRHDAHAFAASGLTELLTD
jgi:hypothetical protein